MGRWKPNAHDRLARAAIELFIEQGFAETTVPQITARAGLTTRTFFRHYADKREVLFTGDEEIPAFVAQLVADAPAAYDPMQVIAYGLEATAARFEGQFTYMRMRQAVIATDQGLRERDLQKRAMMADPIYQGFRQRGVDELTATLAARLGVAVFGVMLDRWLGQDVEQPLAEIVRDTLRALDSLTANSGGPAHH